MGVAAEAPAALIDGLHVLPYFRRHNDEALQRQAVHRDAGKFGGRGRLKDGNLQQLAVVDSPGSRQLIAGNDCGHRGTVPLCNLDERLSRLYRME